MPILGLLMGSQLAGQLGDIGSDIGAALLILTGCLTLGQTRKQATGLLQRNERQRVQSVARLLIMGFALSHYHVPIGISMLAIAATSMGMSLIGLEPGQKLGEWMEQGSEILGGVVLIIVEPALAFHRSW